MSDEQKPQPSGVLAAADNALSAIDRDIANKGAELEAMRAIRETLSIVRTQIVSELGRQIVTAGTLALLDQKISAIEQRDATAGEGG